MNEAPQTSVPNQPTPAASKGLSPLVMWAVVGVFSFVTLVISVYAYFAPGVIIDGGSVMIPVLSRKDGVPSLERELNAIELNDLGTELEEIKKEVQ